MNEVEDRLFQRMVAQEYRRLEEYTRKLKALGPMDEEMFEKQRTWIGKEVWRGERTIWEVIDRIRQPERRIWLHKIWKEDMNLFRN